MKCNIAPYFSTEPILIVYFLGSVIFSIFRLDYKGAKGS